MPEPFLIRVAAGLWYEISKENLRLAWRKHLMTHGIDGKYLAGFMWSVNPVA